MERENRYIVLKRKDIANHLSETEKDKLSAICASISDGRAIENKPDLECVVVESDWPMYEATWDEIEEWVNSCEDCHGTGFVDVGVGNAPCGCGA